MKQEHGIAMMIIFVFVVIAVAIVMLPTCGPGEVMVRGVYNAVCVSGHR